jgi:uncharacterized alpha-E superfamily protein
VLDRERTGGSVIDSLARAREKARQVRDQISTEAWERLNPLYLRATDARSGRNFASNAPDFLAEIIADPALFKGAVDATMRHGEGWPLTTRSNNSNSNGANVGNLLSILCQIFWYET